MQLLPLNRRLALFGLLICCHFLLPAQDSAHISALEKDLALSHNVPERIELLQQLFVAWRNYDSSKAMHYANDAIRLADKSGASKKQSLLLLDKGKFLNINGENEEAEKLMRQALAMAEKNKDHSTQGHALRAIGVIQFDKNDYDRALEYFLQATPRYEKAADKKGLAGNYIWIGNVLNEGLHQPEKAIGYFQKSLQIAAELKDSSLISYNLNNIGQAWYFATQYDSALFYYRHSLQLKTQMQDEQGIGNAYNNLSNVYFDQQQYAFAQSYNDSALAIRSQQGDKKGMATSYLNGANIRQALRQPGKAFAMYQQAIALGRDIGFDEAVYEGYAGLSRYYESKGDLPEALRYYKSYKALMDSVYNATVSQQISSLEKKFATQKKEKQIQEQQFAIQRKNYLLYGSVALFVLLALLGINYYRRYRLKKEQQMQEAIMEEKELSTKAVMLAEENERRRIAVELHDGVGQLMSAVKMNLSALETDWAQLPPERRVKMEKITSLVDESCREVRTVSHSMMPNALLKRGLAAAVRDFLDKIDSKIIQVQLYADGLDRKLEPTVETMLYRIIQESVNNVIKHSGANQLFINLVQETDGLSISIEDNGKGFDSQLAAASEGIGLKNIRSRVLFLKGTLEISSQPGRGTLIAIFLPAASS